MSKNLPLDINSAKDTISNALIREALSVAASRGLNIVSIANRAGISAELLTSTKARVPVTWEWINTPCGVAVISSWLNSHSMLEH